MLAVLLVVALASLSHALDVKPTLGVVADGDGNLSCVKFTETANTLLAW